METGFEIVEKGMTIPCKRNLPENGQIRRIVLGVHGLGGSMEDAIQRSLADEMPLFGSVVVRFDLPAHGCNPMESEDFTVANCVDTLLAVAGDACRQFPEAEALCIFATGFGAYITLNALEQLMLLPCRIRLVVQTPSVLMHETLLSMIRMSRETFWALDRYTFPVKRPFTVDYAFYEELASHIVLNTQPIPMLILMGQEDAYIRMADIQNFRRINEDSRLVILPGISHRFLEDGAWDMVLDLTRDWFEFEQVLLCDWE
jgi:alpha-beta hydrolase superfamily lysophospholipase